MAETDKKQKNYKIECIEDENGPVKQLETEPEELLEDPLDNLPNVSSQTGGLPIVTFVQICLSAGGIMLVKRMLAQPTVLMIAMCTVLEIVVLFGIAALFRGMFQKLRDDGAGQIWYPLSTVIMILGIALGAALGLIV